MTKSKSLGTSTATSLTRAVSAGLRSKWTDLHWMLSPGFSRLRKQWKTKKTAALR